MQRKKYRKIVAVLTLIALMGCSSARKVAGSSVVELSEAEQRRYDLFYMEAQNQQMQECYALAFDLLQHCLTISPTAPSALHGLAQYYDYMGDKERSLALMKQTVQYDPENYWYQENLAQAYYNTGRIDKAVAIYEEMYRRFPRRSSELLPVLIGLYQANKQYDKELEALDALEERYGANEETGMEKFRAHLAMGDEEGAFADMEKMVRDNPGDTRFELMLAELYMNSHRYDEAYLRYLSVLNEEPENDHARLGIARWYEKTGRHAEAHIIVDSLIVYGHLPDEQRIKLASQFVAEWELKGDTTAIDDLFSRILAQPLTSVLLPQAIAAYYIEKNRNDAIIIPILDKILAVEPDNINALKQHLYYAVEHNNTDEVRERSRALLTYYPDELYPYYYLVITALRDDDHALAIRYAEEGISHIGEESDTELCTSLYSMLGDLYVEDKRNEKGYACYDSALVYNPSQVSVLNNYAYNLSLDNRDLDRAEQMSRVTIDKEPENSTYLDTYAWILFMKGRYDEARRYAEQALRNDTTNSWVLHDHAGDILFLCGEKEAAVEQWKEALRLIQSSYGNAKARTNESKEGQKDSLPKTVEARPKTKPSDEERRAEDKLKKKIRLKKWIK